ncbi:hypothetical protein D1159_04150 [Pseudoflavonifractor sp. 524-17]|uniref:hypothetical protein n=1 Tax=Pseudoflavonifractor sp. 524-17 TaxID=2304577 RepID=UPI001379A882|nr:hypothetical protein [Pseudoflavonifractor sp. 524-17]NCE63791.1 hypothetical protein [Pseudoflavonifractor sp. 524-17]
MRKQIIPAALALALTAGLIPASAAGGTAYAATQTVQVDGKAVEFQAYALKDEKGNATNYVKLRDVAYVLNGTSAQFNVGWDGAINILPGQGYTAAGGEMQTPFSGDRSYTTSAAETRVNGSAVKLEAIELKDDKGGAYTYYKLRDLGTALGFKVDWSAQRGIFIETGGAAQSTGDANLDLFQGAWKGDFKNTDGDPMSEELIITGNQVEKVVKNSSSGSIRVYKGTVLAQTNMVNPSNGKTYPYVLTLTINERLNRKTGEMEPYEATGYYYVKSIDSGAGQVNWSFGTYNRMNLSDSGTMYAGVQAELAEIEAQRERVKQYPTYAEFPTVPDFGAIFGVNLVEKSEASKKTGHIVYRYSASDDQWSEYVKILKGCGFKPTHHMSVTGDMNLYYDALGYSVSYIGSVEKIGDRYVYLDTFGVSVQKTQ